MSRAKNARSIPSEDIPVARRSGLSRGSSSAVTWIFLVCGFAIFGTIVFELSGSKQSSLENISSSFDALTEVDGRLLGHFPYPEISDSELVTLDSGIQVHKETAKAYRAMESAAWAEGVDIRLLSGYRSHDLQREIFFEIKSERNQTALERAKVSAPPGHSEHSTGYAIDLGDGRRPETHFREDFESTEAFLWLKTNAAKYHFILSFPPGNSQGVTYEPWHWRFEGTAAALREFEAARKLFSR